MPASVFVIPAARRLLPLVEEAGRRALQLQHLPLERLRLREDLLAGRIRPAEHADNELSVPANHGQVRPDLMPQRPLRLFGGHPWPLRL